VLIRVHLWDTLLRQKLLRVLWLLWEDKQEGRVGMAGCHTLLNTNKDYK